jgi:hypothetical protein
MTLKFEQQRNFATKKFILDDQFVNVEDKSWTEEKSYKIRLDKIGNEKYYHKESMKPKIFALIIIGTILLICNIGYIFFNEHNSDNSSTMIVLNLIFGFIGIFFILKKTKDEVLIIGGEQNIVFFNDQKHSKELNEFIDKLIHSANNYILKKYGRIDADLPEATQMNILRWLRDRELINEEEYENLKRDYKLKKMI